MKECSVCHRQFDYKFTRGRCRTCYHNWWKDNNPEKHTTARKKYYEKNKEKINKRATDWAKENRNRTNAAQRRWKKKNTEKVKEYYRSEGYKNLKSEKNLLIRLKKYKVDREAYEALKEQGCPICVKPFKQTPCFDHCHNTGDFRGLLCRRCNAAIGLLRDCPDTLSRATEYLKKDT